MRYRLFLLAVVFFDVLLVGCEQRPATPPAATPRAARASDSSPAVKQAEGPTAKLPDSRQKTEPTKLTPDLASDLRPSPTGRPVAATLHAADLAKAIFDKAKNEADRSPLYGGKIVRVFGVVSRVEADGTSGYTLYLDDFRSDQGGRMACQLLTPDPKRPGDVPSNDPAAISKLKPGQKVCIVGKPAGADYSGLNTGYLAWGELETDCPY